MSIKNRVLVNHIADSTITKLASISKEHNQERNENKVEMLARKSSLLSERPFDFYGGGGQEDVFGPGYFFICDAVLAFYLQIIQSV